MSDEWSQFHICVTPTNIPHVLALILRSVCVSRECSHHNRKVSHHKKKKLGKNFEKPKHIYTIIRVILTDLRQVTPKMPSVKGTDIIDDSGPSGSSAASLRSSSSVSPSSTTTTRKQRKCDPLTATPTGEKKQKKRFALLNILSTVWMLALMAVLVKPFLYPRPLFVPPYQQLSISPSEIIGQEHVAITVSAGESEDNDALVTSPFTSSISFLNASITAALNLPPAVDCIRVISLRDSELLELFIRDAGSLGFLDRLTVQVLVY